VCGRTVSLPTWPDHQSSAATQPGDVMFMFPQLRVEILSVQRLTPITRMNWQCAVQQHVLQAGATPRTPLPPLPQTWFRDPTRPLLETHSQTKHSN
jgi:hypothetical protein